MPYSTISFNGITLNVESMQVVKRQKTAKQTIGRKVVILGEPLAVEAIEHVLTIKGQIIDSAKDTTKASLESSQDGQRYNYSDGLRSGDYAILDLSFDDVGGTASVTKYDYNMTLVEW